MPCVWAQNAHGSVGGALEKSWSALKGTSVDRAEFGMLFALLELSSTLCSSGLDFLGGLIEILPNSCEPQLRFVVLSHSQTRSVIDVGGAWFGST